MNSIEIIKKIIKKKEFSNLPEIDVELAFEKFNKDRYLDEEKIKLTRNLLRKVFSSFTSQKILSLRNLNKKDEEWFLKKHLSTRERYDYYEDIYQRILKNINSKKEISIIDLGAGVNGFSYKYFEKLGFKVDYLATESIGQLVNLMNSYFEKESLKKTKAIHLSLFNLDFVEKLIKKTNKPRVLFLFKVIDSLEMLKRDYSKEIISNLISLVDIIVLSFPTKSLIRKTEFKAKRKWITNFIEDNFNVLDDFKLSGERYIIFQKKKYK